MLRQFRDLCLSDVQGDLNRDQNTVTIGLIWWWGGKEGSW
jgi:hypothetical protein